MKYFCCIALYLLSFQCFALNTKQQQRLDQLNKEIRCVVCQGQSIADSNAPIAKDMRRKVASLIAQQKTDEEVRDYLAARYGDFILLRPRVNKTTWLLWSFPFIGALLAIALLIRRSLSQTNLKDTSA